MTILKWKDNIKTRRKGISLDLFGWHRICCVGEIFECDSQRRDSEKKRSAS